jgi:signal transduction histidine kinase
VLEPLAAGAAEAHCTSAEEREYLLVEHAHALARLTPYAVVCALLLWAVLLQLVWNRVSSVALLLWAVVLAIWIAATLPLALRMRWGQADVTRVRGWLRQHVVGALFAGVVWASTALLLPGVREPPDAAIVLLVALLAAAGCAAYSPYLPAMYGFAGALAASLVALGALTKHYDAMTTVTLIGYLGLVCAFCWGASKTLSRSIRLSYRNYRLAQAVSEKRMEAERANLAKTRLLAAASHDLRQPMHALNLFVGALREQLAGRAAFQLLDKMNRSVEAMDEMFDALLDVSRLDSGRVVPSFAWLPLQSLFDRVQRDFGPQAEARGLRLRVVPTDAVVYSDALLLERILRNLVSNAVKYTRCGGILIGARKRSDLCVVQVWDTGLGIEPLHLQEVFQEFFQIDSRELEHRKSLGLGLFIVQRLAVLLDHPVSLRSHPQRGSCFSLRIKRLPGPFAELRPALPVVSQDVRLGGTFVLVVDDDAEVRLGTRALLEQWDASWPTRTARLRRCRSSTSMIACPT